MKLVSDEPFIKELTAIAFRKGDTELVEKVNAVLKIKEDGTYDKCMINGSRIVANDVWVAAGGQSAGRLGLC